MDVIQYIGNSMTQTNAPNIISPEMKIDNTYWNAQPHKYTNYGSELYQT